MRADGICGTSKSDGETRTACEPLFLQHVIRRLSSFSSSRSGWNEFAAACTKAALAGILTRNSIITPRRGDHSKMGGTDGKLSISFRAHSFIASSGREQ